MKLIVRMESNDINDKKDYKDYLGQLMDMMRTFENNDVRIEIEGLNVSRRKAYLKVTVK